MNPIKWLKNGKTTIPIEFVDHNRVRVRPAKWHVSTFFAWYDAWVGVFIDREKRIVYVCPVPFVVVKVFWG